MIAALIGLQTAGLMRANAVQNFTFGSKSQMNNAKNSTLYQMATAQADSYQKLLNKNIKSSFSIFA